jgi:hypothetical protein
MISNNLYQKINAKMIEKIDKDTGYFWKESES